MFNGSVLYLWVAVDYYRQLERTNQDLLSALRGSLEQAAAARGLVPRGPEGEMLWQLHEPPREAMECVLEVHRLLAERREELYGFSLFVFACPEEPEKVLRLLRRQLLTIEEDEGIWLEDQAREQLAETVQTRRAGPLWKASAQLPAVRRVVPRRKTAWNHPEALRELRRAVAGQHLGRSRHRGVLVYGPVAAENRLIVDALVAGLYRELPGPPRLCAMPRRRSPVHPFLSAINPNFLPAAGRYLTGREARLWEELAPLLIYLRGGGGGLGGGFLQLRPAPRPVGRQAAEEGPAPPPGICTDRIEVDVFLAFQLYLLAYLHMAEENLLPGLLVLEGADELSDAARGRLALLLRDFCRRPSFVPVFSATGLDLPQELAGLPVAKVAMLPLSLRRMRRLASEVFPGLKLPVEALRTLRRSSQGKLVPFFHALLHLERSRRIVRDGLVHRWQEGKALSLPGLPLALSWQLVSSLSADQRQLLFLAYLQSGLLDTGGFLAVLAGLGRQRADKSLEELEDLGLLCVDTYVTPLFAGLRRRVRARALEEDPTIEERFVDQLLARWRSGEFRQLVLLFFLLVRAGRAEPAAEVLEELFRQKLDELDFPGARLFLDRKQLRFAGALSPARRGQLQQLLAAVRLRASLLEGRHSEAQEWYLKAVDLAEEQEEGRGRGELCLQMARYLAAAGEGAAATGWAKRALMQYQGLEDVLGERRATVELGAVLLAESKVEEALEYLSFAESSAGQGPVVEDLRAGALKGAALFLQGNLSRAAVVTEAARVLAQALGRREWELFLTFLQARLSFELGEYQSAAEQFQGCLVLERLYRTERAVPVLYAWLARSFAYAGAADTAVHMLQELPRRWEGELFLAEALSRRGEYRPALEAVGRAMEAAPAAASLSPEQVDWSNGFAGVEGRCTALHRDGALAVRLLQAFQAYLWGLIGAGERGVEQLHAITRGGSVPLEDPYQGLYHYFYASTLPEIRQGETDDSLTVLNKALKLTQQRASHIEDSTVRYHYLNRNFWNARLLEEARKRRLM